MISLALSIAFAGLSVLVGTPILIRLLTQRGIGEEIRDDGPEGHHAKRGTPTMGGAIIIIGVLCGYGVAHLPFRRTVPVSAAGLLCIAVIVLMGILGFVDDYLKVRKIRPLGLPKSAKFLGQIVIAVGFALAARRIGAPQTLAFIRGGIPLGYLFIPFALLVIASTANGVNLTDGLDGLAAGSSGLVYAAFMGISFWQFSQRATGLYPGPEALNSQLDIAIVAGGMVGACLGFLWWNAAPAKIFMGDTGSLALGGGMAVLAMLTETPLLLVIIGGLFVVETLSVMIQVAVFKTRHRRVFRMAPIHHHFELLGWPEFTVIVRFWIISGLFVGAGLAVFYADFLAGGGAG